MGSANEKLYDSVPLSSQWLGPYTEWSLKKYNSSAQSIELETMAYGDIDQGQHWVR